MTVTKIKARNEPTDGLLLTLNRGIQVLEQIARERGRATAKSLSADLGINLGTCYQLLRTLQANGYAHRLPGGCYGLGTRIGFLTEHYESALSPPSELVDTLHDLHETLQETVYISIRRNRHIPIVGLLEGTKVLRVGTLTVGYAGHPNARASVKALLAWADDKVTNDLIQSRDFQPLTPNTITTWDGFLKELENTRARGYGLDNEEYAEGVACVGAVILDEEGVPYGAYGTSFPSGRLASDEAEIAKAVMEAGERASRFMGYIGPYPPPPTD